MIDNTLPHNIQTEQSVLCCLLFDSDLLYQSNLQTKFFYDSWHRLVFEAIKKLQKDKKVCDVITIGKLIWEEYTDRVMGLMSVLITTTWFKSYCEDLEDYYSRREIIKQSNISLWLANTHKWSITSAVQSAYKFYSELMLWDTKDESTMDVVNNLILNAGKQPSVIWQRWYKVLDQCVWWIRGSHYAIIAARTGIGKTNICINAMSNLMNQWVKTLMISREMPKIQIMERLFSIRYWINKRDIEKSTTEQVQSKLVEWWHLDDITKLEDYIYMDTKSFTDMQVYNSIYNAYYKHWIKVFFIDYIGLLRTEQKAQSKAYEIWEISNRLKELALELDIFIWCIAQINRNGASVPKLEDLRDSWSLEQDADYVLLLTNDRDAKNRVSDVSIDIAKNRHWITAEVKLKQKWLSIVQ